MQDNSAAEEGFILWINYAVSASKLDLENVVPQIIHLKDLESWLSYEGEAAGGQSLKTCKYISTVAKRLVDDVNSTAIPLKGADGKDIKGMYMVYV